MALPRTPSFRLDGRRALVAGATRGIGLGCAVALAESGADVVMTARDAEALDRAVAEMRAAGLSAEGVVRDVTDLDAQARLFTERGPFHILVNAAGADRHAAAPGTPGAGMPDAGLDDVSGVNLKAAYFLGINAARQMLRGGSIIQISGQLHSAGVSGRAIHAAAESGVQGMTRAMAVELRPYGIRVNSICPALIPPPGSAQRAAAEPVARSDRQTPSDRVGQVEDIMGAVVYLASEASAHVTGTSLLLDGGWPTA